MGQKTHPTGLRLGIIKGWESNWYGGRNFADKLIEDELIRAYIRQKNKGGGIAKVVIERTNTRLIITIHTARPGIVIGKGGESVEALKQDVKRLSKADKEVQINIYEVKKAEIDSALVAEQVANQLEARVSFRRAMKGVISNAMKGGAGGIKVVCSGRLGGAEMARTESYKEGRVPLQTLRADIDYATATAQTIYGSIGIKVWIFKGEIFGKVDLSPEVQSNRNVRAEGGQGGNDRRGGGGDRGGRKPGGDRNKGGGERRGGGGGDRNKQGGGDRRQGGGGKKG